MKRLKGSPLVALALICASAAPTLSAQAPALAAEPNWLTVVGLYPGLGTLDAQGERAVMAWLQQARTTTDVVRTLGESHPSLGCWAEVLNRGLAAGHGPHPAISLADYPLTEAVLAQAQADLLPVLGALKDTFARPRPFVSDPSLTPAIPQDTSFSYPSGHAAVAALFARIITQFQPSNQAAIQERGNQIGTDRVLAGAHWPSDAAAGKRLGQAFATYWINQPEHRQLILAACGAEWH